MDADAPALMEFSVLKCRDVTELATDYAEAALPPTRWLAVRWHLALCRNCRAFFGQMRRTSDLLSRIRLPTPPDAEDRVVGMLAKHGLAKHGLVKLGLATNVHTKHGTD